jgi:2C-methyl-D-erythritol 2,4-cyclodiphosphate synthase
MKKRIAEICKIPKERIGITVTSGEKLTQIGSGEGIGVFSTVCLGIADE